MTREEDMSTYTEAVELAAAALKRGEDANWELARLTYENTKNHRSDSDRVEMAQWCTDVREKSGRRFSVQTGRRYKAMWKEFGQRQVPDVGSWTEAWYELNPRDASGPTHERVADQHLRSLPPERKAEVARELLAEPEVAQAVVQDKTTRLTVSRAVDQQYRKLAAEDADRTERKIAEDPVSRRLDSNQAINDLGAACERFSREANEALRKAGDLPDGERYWLTGAVDRAEATIRAARRYLELGRSEIDAELAALLESEA